jgi:cellulose synthase/poly-beta-1,6-N-acetylglucosamine synthase-like glycosyltransferase/peptidoglycan/xylan/chitin deacetylase (PgdA/CDA1 family)
MIAGALLLSMVAVGFAHGAVGTSSTGQIGPPAAELKGAGPLLDLSGPTPRSVHPRDRTVALTFDDGPDPAWTPQVLEVLRRQGVPATFFVVGSRALDHPELVREEVERGHEVGSHTFTHAELGSVSTRRASLELSLTQTSLAGAAGVHTGLFRLPYSSQASAATEKELQAAKEASNAGYLVVFTDRSSEDWRPVSVDAIVANATPGGTDGAVILMHDGGGDRSRTVAALDRLISGLRARGYRFVTVSELAGLHRAASDAPVDGLQRAQGLALLWSMQAAGLVSSVATGAMLPLILLSLMRALVVVVLARRHARQRSAAPGEVLPPVSVIVPAYNEEAGIRATVESLIASRYPGLEIVVVDDGSTDRTAGIVEAMQAAGAGNLVLVRQANGGKHAALNAGLARATHDIVVMIDGDTQFEPGTLRHLVGPLADPAVGAVSGNVKVGNRRSLLGRWQHIEYVVGFNLDRRVMDVLDCIPIVPGAVGAFRRSAIEAAGGLSGETLAEDGDLTMAISRAGWRVAYEEGARAWTEAPATLKALWSQRYRWAYGTMQCMWKHRSALWRRGEGHLGRRALPYMLLFQVIVPFFSPLIDLYALYGLFFLDPATVIASWGAFTGLQAALAVYAFRLEDEPLRPLWALPFQQFVYRQLMYLVVIQSIRSAVAGTRLRWHKLPRTGEVEVPQPAA